ncbi:hypothetical protein [Corallococcus aberystwythensis]|uniref:hypothetical protein n=1 Tax=Corallococcus aberystwythensis TaxID=2316722 RepID=UPI00142EC12E|nr:hypothetical protein [Corallococcus aberystwythensis]
MDAAVLKKVALFGGLTQGQLAKVARIAVLPGTFVRTLSGRLRETNDQLKGFFAISRF